MNQETKTTPTLEKPSKNLNTTIDEKTLTKYSLESKKWLIRTLIVAGAVAFIIIVMSYIETGSFPDIFSIFFFSFPVFVILQIIIQKNLRSKYKIPNVCCNTGYPKMGAFTGVSSLSCHDSDSSYPGSAANFTRQIFDNMRNR